MSACRSTPLVTWTWNFFHRWPNFRHDWTSLTAMQSKAPCFCMKDTGTDAGLFWSVHVIHPPGIVPTQKAAPPGGGAPWRGGLRDARRMMEARRTQALMQACFGVKFRDYCTVYLELQSIQRSEICSPPEDSSHSKGTTPRGGPPLGVDLR